MGIVELIIALLPLVPLWTAKACETGKEGSFINDVTNVIETIPSPTMSHFYVIHSQCLCTFSQTCCKFASSLMSLTILNFLNYKPKMSVTLNQMGERSHENNKATSKRCFSIGLSFHLGPPNNDVYTPKTVTVSFFRPINIWTDTKMTECSLRCSLYK